MIRVTRDRKENNKPIAPSKEWFSKAEELQGRAIKEGPGHRVTNLYKDPEVKRTLECLFYSKCAYCETIITPGFPWDVEHYRPKSRVAERSDHLGYYWLAYSWDNLYPSCVFCNQRKADKPLFDDPRELPAGGKLDQFPIVDESDRAMSPEHDLSKEKPLLLDPCRDNPEEHLTYDVQGQILPIDENDRCAAETIRVFHLQRRRLRNNRARLLITIDKIASRIRETSSLSNTDKAKLIDEIIEDFSTDEREYAGFARAIRRDPDAFLKELLK